ncbi:MAG: DUF1330 domain-containing protein [Xenococcaceae cyanobacterium MO_188.B32]|nr:DUF1330 domain-containing protein [Xenococcaceae cyanobacterium MO_188.B32]
MSTTNDHPYMLVVQLPKELDSADYRARMTMLVETYGGKLLANVSDSEVECLEAITPPMSILVAEFPERNPIQKIWEDETHQSVLAEVRNHPETLILAVAGLPYAGLPDMLEIPTIASVTPPGARGSRAYMLIQGTSIEKARMNQYRDIILPMLKEQGAYYTVFNIEGHIDTLHGTWQHEILAISRWPNYSAGHAFWDSDRYQNIAIPMRTGAGHFFVHFFNGLAG